MPDVTTDELQRRISELEERSRNQEQGRAQMQARYENKIRALRRDYKARTFKNELQRENIKRLVADRDAAHEAGYAAALADVVKWLRMRATQEVPVVALAYAADADAVERGEVKRG